MVSNIGIMMAASNFNLRNIPPGVMTSLKKEAVQQHTSVNSVILHILHQGLGITRASKKILFHDLDHLAGTWTEKEKTKFDKNTQQFGKIDRELW